MIEIFNNLAPAVSIILVGFLTWFFDRRDKKNKRIRELENRQKELETKAIKEEYQRDMKKINSRLESLESDRSSISESIEELREGMDKVIRIILEDREIIEKLNSNFDNDHKNLLKMNDKLDELFDRIENQNENLRNLSTNLHNCIIYTQSVANVVTALAEALRDNHIDGNITKSIAEFRKKEQEIFTAISETIIVKETKKRQRK